MQAYLENLLRMRGCNLADLLGLFFLEEHALFNEDMLAGFETIDHHPRMEIEGRGDQHRVNVLPVQQLPVVLIRVGSGADGFDSFLEVRRVNIASGEASPGWYRGQKPQQGAALRSGADKAITHSVVGPCIFCGCGESGQSCKRGG